MTASPWLAEPPHAGPPPTGCMGGWCAAHRARCAAYHAAGTARLQAVERLCAPGAAQPYPLRHLPHAVAAALHEQGT